MALFGSTDTTTAHSDYEIVLEGGSSSWGKVKARAKVNVPPASPLLPADCNVKLSVKPLDPAKGFVRISAVIESIVDSTKNKLTIEADIANETKERRISVGEGTVSVGDFSHSFSFEGSVVNMFYYRSDAVRRNVPNPVYMQGRQFHDILMKVPLDNNDLIDTWEGTVRAVQSTGAFNDWIRDFWFIGPAFTALNEGGQRISKIEVNSIGTQSGEKGPVGVSRWRFSHGGSGMVDSISRWAELFPADKLNRPAQVEAGFRSDSQGIEVKVDGEFPGVSVDAGGGLRRILYHPLIPLVHHGMVGKFNDFRVDAQLKLVLPKGYKVRYAAPQFRSQNLEEYRWSGGAYSRWVEHVCKGGVGQFEILYAQ